MLSQPVQAASGWVRSLWSHTSNTAVSTSSCSIRPALQELLTHLPGVREQEHTANSSSPYSQQTPVQPELQDICKSQTSVNIHTSASQSPPVTHAPLLLWSQTTWFLTGTFVGLQCSNRTRRTLLWKQQLREEWRDEWKEEIQTSVTNRKWIE